jgi:hypothetical protein
MGVVTGAVASVGLAVVMLGAMLHAFRSLRETVGVGPVDVEKASWTDAQWDEHIAAGKSEATQEASGYFHTITVNGVDLQVWIEPDGDDLPVTHDPSDEIDPDYLDDYRDEARFRESLSEAELAERERNFDEYGHRRSEWV